MASRKKIEAAQRRIVVQIVHGHGTDAEIAERCAAKVPGWEDLNETQQADLVRLMRWYGEQAPSPKMVADSDGPLKGVLRQPDNANDTLFYLRMVETFATPSPELMDQRLNDLARYASKASADDPGRLVSSMLSFIKGAGAEDPVQSALATQMATTHDAAMYALGQMRSAQYVEQAKVFGSISTKLLNAFTRQAEVLTKMQRGGEQVIKHIHIDNRGGQAVVTDQVVTGGHRGESGDQPYAGTSPAMLGAHPFGEPLPPLSDQGQEALPVARRSFTGRAEG